MSDRDLRHPLELRVLKSTLDGIAVEVLSGPPSLPKLRRRRRAGSFWPEPEVLFLDDRAEKRRLRLEMVERILTMDAADRAAQEHALAERICSLPGFTEAHTVLLYVSAFPEEINTGPMLSQSLALGKRLVCPRVDRKAGMLRLYEIKHLRDDLAPGALGIPEPKRSCPPVDPAEVDWLLAPGLAFDAYCYRLGRGAGYYDRLLPTLRADTPRIAFALEPQWIEALPVEPHDQQLDAVVSRARTVSSARRKWPAE